MSVDRPHQRIRSDRLGHQAATTITPRATRELDTSIVPNSAGPNLPRPQQFPGTTTHTSALDHVRTIDDFWLTESATDADRLESTTLTFAHIVRNSSSGGRAAFFSLVDLWEVQPSNMEPDKRDDLA